MAVNSLVISNYIFPIHSAEKSENYLKKNPQIKTIET